MPAGTPGGLPGRVIVKPGAQPVRADRRVGDDATETTSGIVAVNPTSAILTTGSANAFREWYGVRFETIIPVGAKLLSARLRVQLETNKRDDLNFRIFTEASDSPAVFENADLNITSRSRSTAFTDWIAASQFVSTTAYSQSPDITAVVQEWVDRGGRDPNGFPTLILHALSAVDVAQFQGLTNALPPLLDLVYVVLPAVTATATPPPPITVTVVAGTNPSAVETVPVPAIIQGQPFGQPLPVVQVIPGRDPSQVETVPVPETVQVAATLPPPIVVSVTPGLDPSRVETVPVPVTVQANAIPQPPPTTNVAVGRDASSVETVPLALLVQARAIPQPPQPTFGVAAGRDASAVESVSVPRLVQAANIPQPAPPGFGPFVALQTGTSPVATQPWALTIYGAAISQPAPVNGQIFVALQAGTAPAAQATPAITVQAQSIPQPVTAVTGVTRGLDASSVETAPVPKLIQATSIPLTVPAAQVISGLDPNKVETVPLGALIRSKPIEQPPPTVEVRRSFFFVPPNQPWAQTLHAEAICQPLQRVAVWMNLTPGNPPPSDFPGGAFADSVRAGAGAYATRGSAGSTASSSTVTLEATRGGARVDAERAGEES